MDTASKKFSEKFTYFMLCLKHSNLILIESMLKQYIGEGLYLIAPEVTTKGSHKESDGEHFHIAAEMTKVEYTNFVKNVAVGIFKLRGRATKDLPKQYGKPQEIRNPNKMMAYTLKANSKETLSTNIDWQLLEPFKKISYQAELGEKSYQNPWLVDVATMLWTDHRQEIITFCTYCNKPVDKELERLGKVNGFQLISQFEESKKKMLFSLLDMMGDKHKKVSGKIVTDELYGAINYLLRKQKNDIPENWAILVYNFKDFIYQQSFR